jgi:hypothetical protein
MVRSQPGAAGDRELLSVVVGDGVKRMVNGPSTVRLDWTDCCRKTALCAVRFPMRASWIRFLNVHDDTAMLYSDYLQLMMSRLISNIPGASTKRQVQLNFVDRAQQLYTGRSEPKITRGTSGSSLVTLVI